MRALIAAALLVVAGSAFACGYCLEDQIAAVYDHAIVTQALARKHHVAFYHVDGAPAAPALERAVYATPGIDRGTLRVAADRRTVSFAYDPARAKLGALHLGIEKRLAAGRVSLLPLDVIERPGDLQAIEARP